MRTRTRRSLCACLLWLALGPACAGQDAPEGRGEAWPDADALFHRDARFLGADGAYSVHLGGERVLWLMGDTFVARDPARRRSNAHFIRNSVALQTGLDPAAAFMRFYWRYENDEPASFLAEIDDEHWYWPGHGIRLGDTLLLFYERVRQDGPPGPWSFAGDGYTALVVENPDDEPSAWRMRPATLPADVRSMQLGEAVVRDGDFVYVYGTRGARHEVVLARYAVQDAEAGDLSRPSFFCRGSFAEDCAPSSLFELGAPEFSVHHDADLDLYLFIATSGHGPAALAWRAAPLPEGPWTDVHDVYRPVEAHRDSAFTYAGKAHPMLRGGGIVATYVPSSFDDIPPELEESYYFPRFVRLYHR
jgi:hypothetical protein